MKKIIEFFNQADFKSDWKTQYVRYRIGRLKHQYWLKNRKNKNSAVIDAYDYSIITNCKPGKTVFFGSAGYYIKDIFPEVEVIEQHPIVKSFYPEAYISDRKQLINKIPFKVDNFAVVNNRADLWVTTDGLSEHLYDYTKIMNPGCRVFYSFRDTQIWINRLTINMEKHFLDWALNLEQKLDLKLVWHDINFERKFPDDLGNYNLSENPDTTNGNLKFWFVYNGIPWTVIN